MIKSSFYILLEETVDSLFSYCIPITKQSVIDDLNDTINLLTIDGVYTRGVEGCEGLDYFYDLQLSGNKTILNRTLFQVSNILIDSDSVKDDDDFYDYNISVKQNFIDSITSKVV